MNIGEFSTWCGVSFYNRAMQRKDYSDNTNSNGIYPVMRRKHYAISHFTNIVIVQM